MAEIVDTDALEAGDELFSAATEAVDAMTWILGGFDRVLEPEESKTALARYHRIRERALAALEGWAQARHGD